MLVTPVVEPLDDQQPQDDFDRRAVPTGRQAVRVASRHIGFDALEPRLIIEQDVEFARFRSKSVASIGTRAYRFTGA